MVLAKRQKTLLAVFAMGLLGLVVDRVFLRSQGGPRAASAESVPVSAPSVSLADNVPLLNEEAEEGGVATHLNRLWPKPPGSAEFERDPFALPASWQPPVEPPVQPPVQETAVAHPDEAALFVSRHRLTAVVVDSRVSYAIVDDNFLVPGQSLDGFALVSVGERSAVFAREDWQAVLELVDP